MTTTANSFTCAIDTPTNNHAIDLVEIINFMPNAVATAKGREVTLRTTAAEFFDVVIGRMNERRWEWSMV